MRAPLARLVLGLLVAAVTLLPAAPAGAATERYPVPASGEWEIDGRGWGHGIGMSQWGAKGAAEAGLTYGQILDFYYPGTAMSSLGAFPGTTANPTIGVGLLSLGLVGTGEATVWTPAGQGSVRVDVVGGGGVTLGPGRLSITRAGDDFVVVHASTGSRHTLRGTAVRVSTGDGVVVARSATATTGTWYRGTVRVAATSTSPATFDVVNDVPLEEYLRGVVPREMPASWSAHAVRAQAVAARSYMLAEHRRTSTYDTCDTTACQVYGGRATVAPDGREVSTWEHALSDDAVRVTAGQVRTYDGAVATTQFSSTNGGWTVRGGAPYLVARADPYTGTAVGDTRTSWSTTLSATTVARHCPTGEALSALLVTARDGNGALGGRITGLSVECSGGVHTVPSGSWSMGMLSRWWRPQDPPHTFYLANTFTTSADVVFENGYGEDVALVGDWDGDGTDTVALRRGSVYLVRNSNSAGPADVTFVYGRADDVVLVGDWDGDGTDTLAVRRGAEYHVKNSVTSGPADVTFVYGRADDEVHVGDWDGNGTDTLTVRRDGVFHVRNSLTGGTADVVVRYGRPEDVVLTGDWDGDGDDSPAVRRSSTYHLKNAFAPGEADVVVTYGRATDTVLVGDWDADGDDTLGVHRRP